MVERHLQNHLEYRLNKINWIVVISHANDIRHYNNNRESYHPIVVDSVALVSQEEVLADQLVGVEVSFASIN